jgi:hypothetical protein
MPLLNDVATHLENAGIVGGSSGWTVFKGILPTSPDQAVALYDTGGPPPDQTSGTRHSFPTFQIRVRAAKYRYDLARTQFDAVVNSLNDPTLYVLDDGASPTAKYVYCYPETSGPTTFYDENERPQLVGRFRTMKPETS